MFTVIQEVCAAHSAQGQSSNVAMWVPLVCSHGTCITIGTQKGSLLHWGLESRRDLYHASTVNIHDRSHFPSYPQVPIPSV